MTGRQRALVAYIVQSVKMEYFSWRRERVTRLSDNAEFVFEGSVGDHQINLTEVKKHHEINNLEMEGYPWKLQLRYITRRGTYSIKIRISETSLDFDGQDDSGYSFDGTFYSPNQVQLYDSEVNQRDYYRISG